MEIYRIVIDVAGTLDTICFPRVFHKENAAKLVIASNPKVKVFRIARGESLGQKRLETIVDIAKRNGYQGFIENVMRGQEEMRIEEYTDKSV